uniref:TATA-binding protein interacting (TIP20) domain-containing protein n=1 Tax=Cyprinus carpio TaxID=7962 RepID=A0A8C1ZZ27_CYPCA
QKGHMFKPLQCPARHYDFHQAHIQEVKNPKPSESVRILSLLCLEEIGRLMNFEGQKELKGVIMGAFGSPNEEVKSAASLALGEYLPFMLKEIISQPKRQNLLLHSLKEMISTLSADTLKPHVENIWALLFKRCESNIVAECLGKLTLVSPSELLPRLKKQLSSGSPFSRSEVVTAVKFTIVDHAMPIDSLLKGCIGDFLKTLQDPDLNVRRVALVMFNSATQIRKYLERLITMGPFKHTVDDGLDVRKAAFECMDTLLLDSWLDCLDIFEFLNHVEEGMRHGQCIHTCPQRHFQLLDAALKQLCDRMEIFKASS